MNFEQNLGEGTKFYENLDISLIIHSLVSAQEMSNSPQHWTEFAAKKANQHLRKLQLGSVNNP